MVVPPKKIGLEFHFWNHPRALDLFVLLWNENECRKTGSGFPALRLVCLDCLDFEIVLTWNCEGFVSATFAEQDYEFTVSAFSNNWIKFFNGEFSATIGALSGFLVLDGDLQKLLPFSEKINMIALISKLALLRYAESVEGSDNATSRDCMLQSKGWM